MAWYNFRKNRNKVVNAESVRQSNVKDDLSGLDPTEISLVNRIRELEKAFMDIDKGIDEITGPDYRIFTITDWLNAMRAANVPWSKNYFPTWVTLFDIFINMQTDAHIQATTNTLVDGLTSKDFYIANENGEKNDELTKIFKAEWFYDYLTYVVNSVLWGFNLIQIDKVDFSDYSLETREINIKHVRPDLGGIVKNQYDNKVYKSWEKKPYIDWTVFIFNKVLGQYNACVRWWIYKTEVARFWAKYNQLYGTPPVVAKTSVKDATRKDNAITMLKNFIKSRWMVIDKEDELVQFDTKGSANGQQYFENLIRLCDEQISKALLGSTMVMDDGSSRSQSEVHEKNTDKNIKSYTRKASSSVNKELIPRLRNLGFPIPKGSQFIWDNSEKMSMKDRSAIVTELSQNYTVPVDTASEFVGIELEEKEQEFNPTFDIDKFKKSEKKPTNE
jgi:hypothetical protein